MEKEKGSEREVVCIHVGKAGIGSGFSSWELFCLEHDILPDGMVFSFRTDINTRVELEENEEYVEETITYGKFRHFFPKEHVVCGKESAITFSRGYLSLGKDIIEEAVDHIRNLTNDCNNLDGFMLFSSVGGGTGSGLGSLLLERLSVEYPKKSKVGINIFSFPNSISQNNSIVDPYNSVLSMQRLTDHLDVDFLFGNDALNDISQRMLDLKTPNFVHFNRLISHVVGSTTRGIRFGGYLNLNLMELQTNLVPYPRIHFLCSSYAPIMSCEKAITEQYSCTEITSNCFEDISFMWKCKMKENKYLGCTLQYLGKFVPKDISAAVGYIKTKRSIQFVDWSPTGFRCGISVPRPRVVPRGEMAQLGRTCCLTANSTSVKDGFKSVKRKFDLLYEKRAFLHWFLRDGMEEGDFTDAIQNIDSLVKDYEEIMEENLSEDGEFEEGEEEEEEEEEDV